MRKKVILILSFLLVTLSIMGCGVNYSKELQGEWYREGRTEPEFILYSDGTCDISGEYGMGTWAIVNDNQLKLTNYYGEADIAPIISVKSGCLKMGDVENPVIYYNSPDKE